MGLRDFAVDERVIEANLRRIGSRVAKIKSGGPGPINRPETHRAGLTGSVNIAARQFECLESLAGFANRHDFGVRGRIQQLRYAIRALGYDFAVFYNNCSERAAAAGTNILDRQLDRSSHEGIIHRCNYKTAVMAG